MAKETKPKIKVLIGVITYDSDWYCLNDFTDSIFNLDINVTEVEIFIVDNSDTYHYVKQLKKFFHPSITHDPITRIIHYDPPKELKGFKRFRHCEEHCRKMVRDYFLSSDCTHLFFVDSDVIAPRDSLQKLLARDKDIVCAKFNYRDPPEGRTLWFMKKKPVKISKETGVWYIDFISNKRLDWHNEHESGKLIEIDACGFGAILISRKALAAIPFHKSTNGHYGVDIHFCFDAGQAGFKIYGDPAVFCDHRYKQCSRRKESDALAFIP